MLAFIAFNILDLDGSNLISLNKKFEISIFVGDVVATPRIDPFPERGEGLTSDRILSPNDSPHYARLKITELGNFSPLERARSHLYHVSLPRDAVPG